jgi:hypothetical protein
MIRRNRNGARRGRVSRRAENSGGRRSERDHGSRHGTGRERLDTGRTKMGDRRGRGRTRDYAERIHGSSVGYEIVDKWRGSDDLIRWDQADRNDVFSSDNHVVSGHRHHWIEVARGEHVSQVTQVIGNECMNQREVRAQSRLDRKVLPPSCTFCLPSSTIVPTPVGVSTPPRPQPPARMRSTSVPCGTSSITIFLANICCCAFTLAGGPRICICRRSRLAATCAV